MKVSERQVQGLLIDIDGVLFEGQRAIPGAVDFVARLKARGVPHRFVTNTTTLSRSDITRKLAQWGFAVKEHEIMTAPRAARGYLEAEKLMVGLLLVDPNVEPEFASVSQKGARGRAVVVGDIGNRWTYDLLDAAFHEIMNGAELLALHKNKYWQTSEGLKMDIGAFVAGLEYVTGKKAVLAGKPSEMFFLAAAQELRLPVHALAMIGDDIESDVGGAQQAGIAGVLVKTGKYRKELAARSSVVPGAIVESIAEFSLE
jgi:HAD superfamily hydrolase (TIGR01458 family)